MEITNETKALSSLQRIGYYRLSGYWHPFHESRKEVSESGKDLTVITENFHSGTAFSHVINLYVFDKKLRLLLMDALERIEIALRVDVAHLLGKRDCWAHRNSNDLHEQFTSLNVRTGKIPHQQWLERLDKTFNESQEDFVVRFKRQYSDQLPLWMAIELWDFGSLSHFLGGMKIADLEEIARKYSVPRWELLKSWAHSMNYVRNICAHHSRLWNRSLTIQPKFPKTSEIPLLEHLLWNRHSQLHLYSVAAIIQYLLRTINPTSSWGKRLATHMAAFPNMPGVGVGNAGFPDGWERLELWKV